MRPATGRLRFQPSRPAPSLPHQAPNERAENAGTRKRRHPEESSALDPLENTIRRLRTSPSRKHGHSPRRGELINSTRFTDFRPARRGLANRAPDAHVDAMLCIEHDFFADAQSGAGEYGLS